MTTYIYITKIDVVHHLTFPRGELVASDERRIEAAWRCLAKKERPAVPTCRSSAAFRWSCILCLWKERLTSKHTTLVWRPSNVHNVQKTLNRRPYNVLCFMSFCKYTNVDGDLFNGVLLIKLETTEAMVKWLSWLAKINITWSLALDSLLSQRAFVQPVQFFFRKEKRDTVWRQNKNNRLTSSYQALMISFSSLSFVAFIRSWSRYMKT